MLVERSMHDRYLSNSYLIADEPGGTAVIVDSGGPIEPLLHAVTEHALRVTHLFNTHDHHDHTVHNVDLQERFDVPLLTPEHLEREPVLTTGGLHIVAIETPGHTEHHVSLCINEQLCCTGDLIFAGSVGGTLGGGPDGFRNLRRSIMDHIMQMESEVRLLPGHCEETTVGAEWDHNPFVRVWRGLDDEGSERVVVTGHDARLVLWAPDYDGGNKAWVRFEDGTEAIVGGSMVVRRDAAAAGPAERRN